MSLATKVNSSSTIPAAPAGKRNVIKQQDGGSPTVNESAHVPNAWGTLAVKNADYTPVQGDSGKILPCTSTITITLPVSGSPAVPSVDADWELMIQNNGSGTVTVDGDGVDIDGSGSAVSLSQNQGVLVRLSADGLSFQTFRGIAGSGGGGGSSNFADGEVVGGSGTSWTLAHAPSPAESLILVQRMDTGFNIPLLHEEGSPVVGDYLLSGTSITTVNSIAAGRLRAWYRY